METGGPKSMDFILQRLSATVQRELCLGAREHHHLIFSSTVQYKQFCNNEQGLGTGTG